MSWRTVLILALTAGLAGLPQAGCQREQSAAGPAGAEDLGTLELRGMQAFNGGDYDLAIPILQRVAQRTDDPEHRESIAELIRAAQRRQAQPVETANTPNPDELPMPNDPASAQATAARPAQPAPAELAAADRTPHPAPTTGQILQLSIKDLGNFRYYQGRGQGLIPEDVKRLDGVTIRLRGFMSAMDQAQHITRFALVPDLFACCFGMPPQIEHTIVVGTPSGRSVRYFMDEIIVEGTLSVGETYEDGFLVSIFQMEASSIRPAPD